MSGSDSSVDRTLHILYRTFDLASYSPLSPPRLSLILPVSSPTGCRIFPNDLADCLPPMAHDTQHSLLSQHVLDLFPDCGPFQIRHLLRRPSTGRRMHSRITHRVILPASLRYRLLSETRGAVCLILGPVFVLWFEGYSAEEGRSQAKHLNELGHPGAGESLAAGDVRLFSALQLSSPSVSFVSWPRAGSSFL